MWDDQVLSPLIKCYFRLRIHYCKHPGMFFCVYVSGDFSYLMRRLDLVALTLETHCLDLHLGSQLLTLGKLLAIAGPQFSHLSNR